MMCGLFCLEAVQGAYIFNQCRATRLRIPKTLVGTVATSSSPVSLLEAEPANQLG
jgi:hypothetical protein